MALPYYVKALIVESTEGLAGPDTEKITLTNDSSKEIYEKLTCGSYCGWVKIEDSPVYHMIADVYLAPKQKVTINLHVLNKFSNKLDGKQLKMVLVERMRGCQMYHNDEEHDETVKADITYGKRILEMSKYQKFKNHTFFTENHEMPLQY